MRGRGHLEKHPVSGRTLFSSGVNRFPALAIGPVCPAVYQNLRILRFEFFIDGRTNHGSPAIGDADGYLRPGEIGVEHG